MGSRPHFHTSPSTNFRPLSLLAVFYLTAIFSHWFNMRACVCVSLFVSLFLVSLLLATFRRLWSVHKGYRPQRIAPSILAGVANTARTICMRFVCHFSLKLRLPQTSDTAPFRLCRFIWGLSSGQACPVFSRGLCVCQDNETGRGIKIR